MSCQICHSWMCKCPDTLPEAIRLSDRIAALEKQNAELLAALKEIADIKLADLPLDTAGVMEPHRMQGIAWRAIDKALGVVQPSTQEATS